MAMGATVYAFDADAAAVAVASVLMCVQYCSLYFRRISAWSVCVGLSLGK